MDATSRNAIRAQPEGGPGLGWPVAEDLVVATSWAWSGLCLPWPGVGPGEPAGCLQMIKELAAKAWSPEREPEQHSPLSFSFGTSQVY